MNTRDQSLLDKLSELLSDFSKKNAWKNSEEGIQSLFTLDLLRFLGWDKHNIIINQGQDVKTGKKPDILLKDDDSGTMLVIESKDATCSDKLDGSYKDKTFEQQLFGYSNAEGIHWGILTNFVEWRIYSVHQKRLYLDKKFAFHKLLWPDANAEDYIDLSSKAGVNFFNQLRKDELIKIQGRIDISNIYYPKQDNIRENFFERIKIWRSLLRSAIRNKYSDKYSLDEIDIVAQRLIDRLIFIDYCSDNKIIGQNKLAAILYSKKDKWFELTAIFSEMNEKFNTELFTKSACDSIHLEDAVILPIIRDLEKINFCGLSVSIIGEVYENYLGELLQKSKAGVKVKEGASSKKRKEGGIYYTPGYVVDYMVNTLVGERLSKCKTEKEIESIRVIDPSCGSGSFLIRVFDEFKKHYLRVNKNQTTMFEFDVRKKILQSNIFGVDLDPRAVEIAKLNLMIKALEGIGWQDLKGRKLLPSLELNIRHGNSLIGRPLIGYEDKVSYLSEEKYTSLQVLIEKYKIEHDDVKKVELINKIHSDEIWLSNLCDELPLNIDLPKNEKNVLNYDVSFPIVRISGGFDIVIGNPPYLNVEMVEKTQKEYFQHRYSTFYKRFDMFGMFYELGMLGLSNDNGSIGFVVPAQIFNNLSYKKIREIILSNKWLSEVLYLGDKVFPDANNDVCVLFLNKSGSKNIKLVNALDFNNMKSSVVPSNYFTKYENQISYSANNAHESLYKKILTASNVTVQDQFEVFQGIVTGNNSAFLPTDDEVREHSIEKRMLHRVLHGRDIDKWSICCDSRRIIYTNGSTDIEKSPNTEEWLKLFYKDLSKRRECRNKVIPWFSLQWPREKSNLDCVPKIAVQATRNPRLKQRIVATMDENGYYGTQGINFIVPKDNGVFSIYALLGILNSSLINFLFKTKYLNVAIKADYLKRLVLPKSTPSQINRIEKYVKKALASANDLDIKACEKEIDEIVFEMYDLNNTEKEIVRTTA